MKLKKEYMFCFITGLIVFLFFLHTLFYPWRHFDEQIIYNETILPIPRSLLELFEYIKQFGLNSYFEASNPFYSSISNLRSDPFNFFIILVVYLLFQKNVFLYHSLSLIFHILNSCLLFLLLNNIYSGYFPTSRFKFLLISCLTLFWALNPLNIESVLFSTNWSALFTYFLSLLAFYLSTTSTEHKGLLKLVLIFILFLTSLFTCEHVVMLPVILFCYLCGVSIYFKKAVPFKTLFPFLAALIPFIIRFVLSQTRTNLISSNINSFQLFYERILWLSPQIFVHIVKLILFPLHLSIDQSSLVKLSGTLFKPYSIFCFFLMLGLIIYSAISVRYLRKKTCFCFFILFVPFFISLFPFLHIISPIYNLVSERYLYLPIFFFTLGMSHVLFLVLRNTNAKQAVLISSIVFLITLSFSIRAYFRTLDWKDTSSLFQSAIKEARTDLIKGLRMQMLGGYLSSYGNNIESQKIGENLIIGGLDTLKSSIVKLESHKTAYKDQTPAIISFYGLNPKTIEAKAAYLIAFTKLGLERNLQAAYEIMKPCMEDFSVIDTQILDLYVGILFALNKTDEAETLLKYASGKKVTPSILLPLSEIYKNKYKDFTKAEALLKKSFGYFPYDPLTLQSLRDFYLQTQNPSEYAYYSYLHGIRTHSKQSLQEAYLVYKNLYNQEMSDKILNIMKTL